MDRHFRFAPVVAAWILCAVSSGAQTGNGDAKGVAIQTPQMPTITAPGIGTGFYSPAQPPFVPAPPYIPAPQQQTRTAQTDAQQNETEGDTRQNSGAGESTALTAARLSELGGILGPSQWSSLFSDTAGMETGSVNGALQNLLSRLEALEKTVPHQTPPAAAAKNGAQILRFRINGNDILSSCRDIHFSRLDTAGAFLLTGDRKFTYDRQIHDETFYFLFKPRVLQSGTATYDVAVSVSGADSSVQSYLKQLLNRSPLSAFRTGNLVIVRSEENTAQAKDGVIVDLLIDLGAKQSGQ